MSQSQINIRSDQKFPWHFKLVAVVLILVSLAIVADHPIISAVISFVSLLILTARGGTEIDLQNKTFREYMSFFYVIRMGEKHSYPDLEMLYINAHNQSQQMYAYSTQSMTVKEQRFNVFLKFTDDETLKLWSEKNKQDLKQKAQALAKRMNLPLRDFADQEQDEN